MYSNHTSFLDECKIYSGCNDIVRNCYFNAINQKAPDGIRDELRECAKIISFLDQKMLSINENVKNYHDDFNGGSAMAAATSEEESSNDNKIPDTLKPLFGSLHNNEANS